MLNKIRMAIFPKYKFTIAMASKDEVFEERPLRLESLGELIITKVNDSESNLLHMRFGIYTSDIIEAAILSGHIKVYKDYHYYISKNLIQECNKYKLVKY